MGYGSGAEVGVDPLRWTASATCVLACSLPNQLGALQSVSWPRHHCEMTKFSPASSAASAASALRWISSTGSV